MPCGRTQAVGSPLRGGSTLAGVVDGEGIDDGKEFGNLGTARGGGQRKRHRVLNGRHGPRLVGPVIPFLAGIQFGKLFFQLLFDTVTLIQLYGYNRPIRGSV